MALARRGQEGPSAFEGEGVARGPVVREASALEAYNVPLFEIPPMLDVRSAAEFAGSHVFCTVSAPQEDGPEEARLLERILEHDENWGWCLEHPFFVVYDDATRERAEWLVGVLRGAVLQYAAPRRSEDRENTAEAYTADRGTKLLRRLADQCRQILYLRHDAFQQHFPFCCAAGAGFASEGLFEKLGPLPRCAFLQPRVFAAGRQVKLTTELLQMLGVTHVVVNSDSWDAMDGTSGGGGTVLERPKDTPGVRYLKCEVPEEGDDPDIPEVLQGAAKFLASCAAEGGVGLVKMHGQSRSLSVLCAFLIVARGFSVDAAWRSLEEARIQFDSKLVWWEALRALAGQRRALQNAATAPSGVAASP